MPLIVFSFVVFVIGVLFFRSSFAWLVSWVLLIVGIFQFIASKDTIKKKTDLSYIFKNQYEPSISDVSPNIKSSHKKHESEPDWDIELLQIMDWKRFEDLCCAYFQESGFRSVQTPLGPDDGIDIFLYENDSPDLIAIVQCKRWTNVVGVKEIRQFLGVMHHEEVKHGYFITSSSFNKRAKQFALSENLTLVNSNTFVDLLKDLPIEVQKNLYQLATIGDYITPTCARCGCKMRLRDSKGEKFWGCKNYPRCKNTLFYKSTN